ncbi:MAG: LemA family protein, partial [Phycisphaerae bacterium]|nr:LemA family protein [Phycisphaerae bacterium]
MDAIIALATETTMMVTVIVLLFAALGLWTAIAFNKLIREKNLVAEGWSGIDVQLKRRHNLIPNLVETVKGYSRHEQKLLTDIVELRNRSRAADRIKEKEENENALTDQLKTLFALAEDYPELKANQNVMSLQEELTSTENKIAFSRQSYNDQVLFF